jgi:hypothetical protein
MLAVLQPPLWRPFQEVLAEGKYLLIVNWFVPSGVKMVGDGVSVTVERINARSRVFIFGSRALSAIF